MDNQKAGLKTTTLERKMLCSVPEVAAMLTIDAHHWTHGRLGIGEEAQD